ncbi:hypothetical protein FQA39_LY14934 [Lamprigera yunnana]|nr:hypothetical protein FQA39_LY14934 [Lamprigera yunnana]
MQIIFPLLIGFFIIIAITNGTTIPSVNKESDDYYINNVNPELISKEPKRETTITPETHFEKPVGVVAKIIDDIFQIPIGVLQSVSRLLKNPFIPRNKTPETVSSY